MLYFATFSGGNWRVYKNNKDVSLFIPPKQRDKLAITSYQHVTFSYDGKSESFSEYVEDIPQHFKEWSHDNDRWLRKLCNTDFHRQILFRVLRTAEQEALTAA